jgi:adenylosuccinate lyase
MSNSPLLSISPIDGRYQNKTNKLQAYFSEFALIKYRVVVEIEYFIALCELGLPQLKNIERSKLEEIRAEIDNFSIDSAQEIKDIEKTTNHDVKAVEYFIKKIFDQHGLSEYKEFIHFSLTSQDINNTAFPMMFKDALNKEIIPELEKTIVQLSDLAQGWKHIPLLSRTHGQAASPSTVGKELNVFVYRLNNQIKLLKGLKHSGKFGGATGNHNAHLVAFPDIDWITFSDNFLSKLGLERQRFTTQIDNYDMLSAFLDNLKRINTIIIDLNRDIWTYISMDYFKQKIVANEIGSSAMPHKVNPIDFENSEGNLGYANAILNHLSEKLPISRLQRDLTDSTVLRNLGVPLGHIIIALKSTQKGLDKLLINEEKLTADLNNNWAIVAEGIQTILRKLNYPNPYETLKELTRQNEKITETSIHSFIETLDVDDSIKKELHDISPSNYTGLAEKIPFED